MLPAHHRRHPVDEASPGCLVTAVGVEDAVLARRLVEEHDGVTEGGTVDLRAREVWTCWPSVAASRSDLPVRSITPPTSLVTPSITQG